MKPETINDTIEREVALTCLNWAQSILDEKEMIYKHVFLNLLSCQHITDLDKKVSAKFELELRLEQKKQLKNTKQIRKGSSLIFRSVPDNQVVPILPVSF